MTTPTSRRMTLVGFLVATCVAGLATAQPAPGVAPPPGGGGALGGSLQEVLGGLDASGLGQAARGTTRLDLGGQQVALGELLGWVQGFAVYDGRPLSPADRAARARRAGELSRMVRQARGALLNGRGGPAAARNLALLASFDRLAAQLDGVVKAPGLPTGLGATGVPGGMPMGHPGVVPGALSPGAMPGMPGGPGLPGAAGLAPGSAPGVPGAGGLSPGGVPGVPGAGGLGAVPSGQGLPGAPEGLPSSPGALGVPGGMPGGAPGVPGGLTVPGGVPSGSGLPGATGLKPGLPGGPSLPGGPGLPGARKAGAPTTAKGAAKVPTPPAVPPTAVPKPPAG